MIFEAGNETREKIWSDFSAEQKWRAERKDSDFCSYRCFSDSAKLMCVHVEIFFVHVRLLKAVFLQLLKVIRFDYDIILVLGLFR